MPRKSCPKFSSLSTPGLKQDLPTFLVELAFLRQNHGVRLTEYFWRQTQYKWRFGREIQGCRKFIKKYGDVATLKIAIENYIKSWCDYATLEVLFQKLFERAQRLSVEKDNSLVEQETVKVAHDLREFKTIKPTMGLFEKLEALNG